MSIKNNPKKLFVYTMMNTIENEYGECVKGTTTRLMTKKHD